MPEEDKGAPPKIRTNFHRPELTRLPDLTLSRRVFRVVLRAVARLVCWLFAPCQIKGLENFPLRGPALIVSNHLGDTDSALGVAYFPVTADALAGIEMFDFPILGKIMDWYGVIWIHRGQPDRRALSAALESLKRGRLVGITPEGRESVTGVLEEGVGGAAFLALKAGVPLVPVAFTGTENWRVYGNMKKLRRTPVSMTIGNHFFLKPLPDRKEAVRQGTETIMNQLAELLPSEYRGRFGRVREEPLDRV